MLRRPSPTSPLAVLLIAGLGLGLAGCVPSEPTVTPPPSPSAEPVFASDEEALAAAEEAYAAYLDAVVQVLTDGGARPERVAEYTTAELFESELEGYKEFEANGWRGAGQIVFSMQPQSLDLATGDLAVYVCEDRTSFEILDADGAPVAPADTPPTSAIEVQLQWDERLVVASQESWSGSGVCS